MRKLIAVLGLLVLELIREGLDATDQSRNPPAQDFLNLWAPARPGDVFTTFWHFAAERHAVYLSRLRGASPPWTHDPIIQSFRFTNVFRSSDRVSQYLIAKVIYEGDWSPEDTLFRILLFKFFNRIETWEMLEARVGPISYGGYRFERYDLALSEALAHGLPVYSPAYIMPSPGYGHARKHANHLALLESIMRDRVSARVARCRSMREMFELLLSYRGVGAFLAFQYATDLNYSDLTDFAESDFVVPGPGARNGIQKCFPDLGGTAEDDLIRLVSERQEEAFSQLGLHPVSLWGRRVQLIDCQNLFCEIDKYARVAHPDVLGRQHRTRIKQHYSPGGALEKPWFPPKWGVNESVERWIQSAHASL